MGMNKKGTILLILFIILGLIIIIAFRSKPDLASTIILFLTLLILVVYTIDTNRIANYNSKQFNAYWVAGIFSNFSTRIDSFYKDLDLSGIAFTSARMSEHFDDTKYYFDVFEQLFLKKEDKLFISKQGKEFKQLCNEVEKNERDKDYPQLTNCRNKLMEMLKVTKREMQIRIGKLV